MQSASHKPPQHQDQQPGIEHQMYPKPKLIDDAYQASGKLRHKVALITGGDSGIGAAAAILLAKEGADIAIVYLNEEDDAHRVKQIIEASQRRCLLIRGDIRDEVFCQQAIEQTLNYFHQLNILINNAAEQYVTEDIRNISAEQLHSTFATNIYAMFYLTKAALAHLHEGDCIINTTSVVAYRGSDHLLDYAATKGAIVSFTRSLAKSLLPKGIRVNGVAPGPIWTPLIPATFPSEQVGQFGGQVPMQRPGEPCEVAPCYVFLASKDSSYMTGQVLHPNGGEAIGG